MLVSGLIHSREHLRFSRAVATQPPPPRTQLANRTRDPGPLVCGGWQNTYGSGSSTRSLAPTVALSTCRPVAVADSMKMAIPQIRGAGRVAGFRCSSSRFVNGGKGKCGRAREADLKRAGMAARSLPWTALVPTDCTGIGGGPEEQTRPAAHPASLAPSTSTLPPRWKNNACRGGKDTATTDIRVLVRKRRPGRRG